MARTNNLTNFLTDVASAIKTKTGDSTPIPASQFDTKIADISTGNLSDEEYAEANTDLDEILEESTPTTIYPPDWSQIGYEDTPQSVIDDFNYSKNIKDTWDSSVTSLNSKFAGNTSLRFMPLVDTSNATDMYRMFASCSNLVSISKMNTEKVTRMYGMFSSCSNLVHLDLSSFNTSNVTDMSFMFSYCSNLQYIQFGKKFTFETASNISGIFSSCSKLSNETLNSILEICTTFGGTSNKTLQYIGLTQAQATTCQSLSNYQAFLDAGWTTGY